MGRISECLMVLFLFQTISILMADDTMVDVPEPHNELIEVKRDAEDLQPEEDLAALDLVVEKRKGRKGGGKCSKPSANNGRSVKQLNQDYLKWHNYYRCLHGVKPLVYNSALEKAAKKNVDMNVRSQGMAHTHNNRYGENLWAKWGTRMSVGAVTGRDPVEGWYSEMRNPGYDFNRPTMFSSGTGHFTQVVWADSKKLGCWTAAHDMQGMTRVFVACEYDPPGNMNIFPRNANVKNWKTNVPRPK